MNNNSCDVAVKLRASCYLGLSLTQNLHPVTGVGDERVAERRHVRVVGVAEQRRDDLVLQFAAPSREVAL